MIEINLFWILVLIVLVVIVFVILIGFKNLLDNKKDIHFKDKDTEITKELTNVNVKFAQIGQINPNSPEDLIILNNQNVENNQEIQQSNERLELLEHAVKELNKRLDLLEEAIRINAKNIMELKNNG